MKVPVLFLWTLFVRQLDVAANTQLDCPVDAECVYVGAVLAESGRQALQGTYFRAGYEMLLQEVNAQGGVYLDKLNKTMPLALVTGDSTSDSEVALHELNALFNSSVHPDPHVLFADYGAVRSRVLCKRANELKIPIVNCGGTTDIYVDQEYSFGLLSPIEQLAQTTMDFLKEQVLAGVLSRPFQISLVVEQGSHGESYGSTVEQVVQANPDLFEIVYSKSFPYPNEYASPEDFAWLVEDMVKRGALQAHGFLCDAHSGDFVLLHQQLVKFDFEFEFVTYGARGADTTDKNSIAIHPQALGGLVSAQWWNPSIRNTRSVQFLNKWRVTQFDAWMASTSLLQDLSARFADTCDQLGIEWYGVVAYEAARTLVDALRRAGDLDPENIKHALKATNITDSILPGGVIRFDRPCDTGCVLNTSTINMMNNQFTLVQNMQNQPANFSYTLFPEAEKTGSFEKLPVWRTPRPVCTKSNMNYTISECTAEDNAYNVMFHWQDFLQRPCPDPTVPCACEGGDVLPGVIKEPCEFIQYGTNYAILVYVLTSAGSFICAAYLVGVLVYYKQKVMTQGQKEFLVIICVSGVVLCLIGLLSIGPNTNSVCAMRVCFTIITLTTMLGALSVKVHRIYMILNQNGLTRVKASTQSMILLLLVLVGVQIFFIGMWMSFQLPSSKSQPVDLHVLGLSEPIVLDMQICVYAETAVFPVICLVYTCGLMIWCNIISFRGRNADMQYMESMSIMFASYNVSIMALLFTGLCLALNLNAANQFVIIVVGHVLAGCIVVVVLITPKFLYLFNILTSNPSRNANTSRFSNQASRSRCTSTSRRTSSNLPKSMSII